MNVHSMGAMKTVLITGSTSGIGRVTALALAAAGHRVIATGRNAAALAELQREAQSDHFHTLTLDVTDRGQLRDVVASVEMITEGRGLDVLVNNAGFGIVGPSSELGDADLRAQFETNVFGLMAVTRAFVPRMRERGQGTIINVSSVGGRMTLPFLGGYNATKYAVESLSDALRRELHAFGIHVVLVEPGLINTNFTPRSTGEVNRWVDSPYAGAFEHAEKLIAQTEAMGVPADRIASVIRRIIDTRRPRARYVAPFTARLTLALAAVLPTALLDALLRRVARLRASDLRALPAAPVPERAAG
jgi:short-subunit dehydrogenase